MPKSKYRSMSSPLKPHPEAVADKVLKRVEVSKVRLQDETPPLLPTLSESTITPKEKYGSKILI